MQSKGFDGMDAFLADMIRLAPEIRGHASKIIEGTTNSAALEIKSNYGYLSGNLRKGVSIKAFGDLKRRIFSRAPHAHLYERGSYKTGIRHTKTGAARGQMPARPVLIPAAIKWRQRMVEQIRDAFRRAKVAHTTGQLDTVERGH